MTKQNLSESILTEIDNSGILNLYDLYSDKEYNSEGKDYDAICRDVADEIASGVESAEVVDKNIDNDGMSLYIKTNNGFAAWMDYWIDEHHTDVEGDLSENELMGDWNASIFYTDDPGDMITKYVQQDDDVFMTMESTGYDYIMNNGYIVETPIKRTNGMEVCHYEWKRDGV